MRRYVLLAGLGLLLAFPGTIRADEVAFQGLARDTRGNAVMVNGQVIWVGSGWRGGALIQDNSGNYYLVSVGGPLQGQQILNNRAPLTAPVGTLQLTGLVVLATDQRFEGVGVLIIVDSNTGALTVTNSVGATLQGMALVDFRPTTMWPYGPSTTGVGATPTPTTMRR